MSWDFVFRGYGRRRVYNTLIWQSSMIGAMQPCGGVYMGDNKKKRVNSRVKRNLIIMWAIFIPVLVFVVLFLVKNKDELMDGMGFSEDHIYEVDANPEINRLVTDFFTAYAACDQMTLQKLVVDPTQFNDMTIVQKKAAVVTGYKNIKCYTVKGLTDDATVVYAMANISIANVISTPLELNHAMYVVKKGNTYLIDNSALGKDVLDYISTIEQKPDIQELAKTVKADQEKCAAEDETFREFYKKLTENQNQKQTTGETEQK